MNNPSDISHTTIEGLFLQQIRECTKQAIKAESLDKPRAELWM